MRHLFFSYRPVQSCQHLNSPPSNVRTSMIFQAAASTVRTLYVVSCSLGQPRHEVPAKQSSNPRLTPSQGPSSARQKPTTISPCKTPVGIVQLLSAHTVVPHNCRRILPPLLLRRLRPVISGLGSTFLKFLLITKSTRAFGTKRYNGATNPRTRARRAQAASNTT